MITVCEGLLPLAGAVSVRRAIRLLPDASPVGSALSVSVAGARPLAALSRSQDASLLTFQRRLPLPLLLIRICALSCSVLPEPTCQPTCIGPAQRPERW